MYRLAERQGVMMHAAAAVMDGRGVVLAGVSGAGKSTITRLLMAADKNVVLLSDDRVVLRKSGGRWFMFGTPWPGEARVARNIGTPLGALLFLEKDQENRVETCSPGDLVHRFMPVVHVPWYDGDVVGSVLGGAHDLLVSVAAGVLRFRRDACPIKEIRDFVRGAA